MDEYENTTALYNRLAQAYQDKFMTLDLYDATYDAFCNIIANPNARIFEIGCGPGNITKYLLNKYPGFRIDAIDVAPNMIALAKQNNPSANFSVMDCRTINLITSKFDAVMCGFCMPYLSADDCKKLIADSAALLNPGGVFYGSMIEGEPEKSGYQFASNGIDKAYIHYHTEVSISDMLKTSGFETIGIFRIPYQKAMEIETHLILIAKKS